MNLIIQDFLTVPNFNNYISELIYSWALGDTDTNLIKQLPHKSCIRQKM